jgi:integrase
MAWGRVYREGDKWYTDIRYAGKRYRKMIGKNRQVAERILQAELGRLTLEEHGLLQNEKIKLDAFAVDYLNSKRQVLRPKSYQRVASILNTHLSLEFGHLFLYDITPARVYAYQTKRLARGISNASFNRELSCLKNLLSTAVAWKKLKTNPIAGVKQLKEPPGRVRFLMQQEADKLLDCCPPEPHPLRDIILFALNTGCRRSEILNLHWSMVKLPQRVALLPNSKTNTVRIIHLNRTVCEMLESLPSREGYVFAGKDGQPIKDIKRSFHTACRKAGLIDYRLHDCRHSFASHLVMAGVPARVIQELLGHASPSMTARYSHLQSGQLQQAVALLDAPK